MCNKICTAPRFLADGSVIVKQLLLSNHKPLLKSSFRLRAFAFKKEKSLQEGFIKKKIES